MKYVLLLACLVFGTAYADGSYICQNYGGILHLGQRTIYSGGDDVQMTMKLNIMGNVIHIEDDQIQSTCLHNPGTKPILEQYGVKNTVDCECIIRIKGENDTFQGLFTLDKALLEGAPQGQFYRMGNDVFLIFNCVQG